jgi:hypothetical protein
MFRRDGVGDSDDGVTAARKGYLNIEERKFIGGEGMPRSRDEWEPIMKFWSNVLERRIGGSDSQVYEVVR